MNKKSVEFEVLRNRALMYLDNAGLVSYQTDKLEEFGYFEAPASKGHHLACPGGLIRHSMNVVDHLLSLQVFSDIETAYRVGMLHDLVKCMCYRAKEDGTYEYVQQPYPGHGVASVMIAQELTVSLNPLEVACITWHMGAFGFGERELKEYHAAIRRFPREIILTHAADHLASALEEGGAK